MSNDLIEVASFTDYIEANIAKTKLESEGIQCFIFNDIIVTLDWFYSNLYGGVRLMVSETEQKMAQAALAVEPIALDRLDREAFAGSNAQCPECLCFNVYEDRWPRLLIFLALLPYLIGPAFVLLSLLLLVFYIAMKPRLRRKHICAICGHSWKSPRNSTD